MRATPALDTYSDRYDGEYILRQKKTTIITNAKKPRTLANLSKIYLNVKDRCWRKYMYQFGHELYHYTDGNLEEYVRHQWFAETIAEMHSLFVLDVLAKKWERDAPYSNWMDYASSIREYCEYAINDDNIGIHGHELAEFFKSHRESLEKNPYIRYNKATKELEDVDDNDKIRFVNVFSPILYEEVFKKDYNSWEALKVLHKIGQCKELSFEEYINKWYDQCDDNNKKVVAKVASILEIDLLTRPEILDRANEISIL